MNLIVNQQLDRQQERAIYELTLKKRRSKKSTVSEKQVAAMQQLASELIPERKELAELVELAAGCNYSAVCRCNSTLGAPGANGSRQALPQATNKSTTTTTTTLERSIRQASGKQPANELQRQSSTSTIATSSSSSSSSSSSLLAANQLNSTISTASSSDETSIKLNQLRLEQLNNELERRLHQYEYLVAQEKAILGTYNKHLFTNEGVNNFHLYRLGHKS